MPFVWENHHCFYAHGTRGKNGYHPEWHNICPHHPTWYYTRRDINPRLQNSVNDDKTGDEDEAEKKYGDVEDDQDVDARNPCKWGIEDDIATFKRAQEDAERTHKERLAAEDRKWGTAVPQRKGERVTENAEKKRLEDEEAAKQERLAEQAKTQKAKQETKANHQGRVSKSEQKRIKTAKKAQRTQRKVAKTGLRALSLRGREIAEAQAGGPCVLRGPRFYM